jgi:LAGLIDADG endonuclease
MLALNLAICWKHLKRSISSKLFANYSSFNSTLRENDTLKLGNIETIKDCKSNIELNRIFRDHTLNTTNISSYLAGLIEGDGCIYVPITALGTAKVTIIFNSKDLPLALLIQKELKTGNIYKKKGKNAYEYVISNLEGLNIIANLINGFMRTHKINKLYELID